MYNGLRHFFQHIAKDIRFCLWFCYFSFLKQGEFNSGKSTVINALLGRRYLKDGVVPTTNEITFLRYSELDSGEDQRCERHPDGQYICYLPASILKEVSWTFSSLSYSQFGSLCTLIFLCIFLLSICLLFFFIANIFCTLRHPLCCMCNCL